MAMSESRKKKLQMLLRSPSRRDLAEVQRILRETKSPREADEGSEAATGAARSKGPVAPLTIVEACPGIEYTVPTATGDGRCWLIRRELHEFFPDSVPGARRCVEVLRGARQHFDELSASPALCHTANARPEDLLFMDIETCGLAGASIFLIGVMFFADDGRCIFEQYLARTYAEEAAILQAFSDHLADAGVLVTFNGKAFDMTMIRERSAFHAVELPQRQEPHLDLLHESRRRWRGQLPNCRLQTLERHLCSRHRQGDIPGAEIPDAYHHFVRTGDARRVRDILHHNLLDLLTMGDLLTAILTGCDPSVE